MAKAGKPADEILEQTGWFQHPTDGQWRFEIDDSASKLGAIGKPVSSQDLLRQAMKMQRANKSPDEILQATGWRPAEDGKWGGGWDADVERLTSLRGNKLGNRFKHDELYAAYPHLADVELRKMPPNLEKSGALGGFQSDANTISVGSKGIHQKASDFMGQDLTQRGTILHELQHPIQELEKFPRSSAASPGTAKP